MRVRFTKNRASRYMSQTPLYLGLSPFGLYEPQTPLPPKQMLMLGKRGVVKGGHREVMGSALITEAHVAPPLKIKMRGVVKGASTAGFISKHCFEMFSRTRFANRVAVGLSSLLKRCRTPLKYKNHIIIALAVMLILPMLISCGGGGGGGGGTPGGDGDGDGGDGDGGDGDGTVIVPPDPTIQFDQDSYAVLNDEFIMVTLERSNDTTPQTFTVSRDDSFTAPPEIASISPPLDDQGNTRIDFGVNIESKTLTITAGPDIAGSGDGTMTLTIVGSRLPPGYQIVGRPDVDVTVSPAPPPPPTLSINHAGDHTLCGLQRYNIRVNLSDDYLFPIEVTLRSSNPPVAGFGSSFPLVATEVITIPMGSMTHTVFHDFAANLNNEGTPADLSDDTPGMAVISIDAINLTDGTAVPMTDIAYSAPTDRLNITTATGTCDTVITPP